MVNNYDFTKYNFLLTIPGNFITGLLDIDEALAAVCRPLHQLNASTNCGTRYSPHVARWPGRAVGVGGRLGRTLPRRCVSVRVVSSLAFTYTQMATTYISCDRIDAWIMTS